MITLTLDETDVPVAFVNEQNEQKETNMKRKLAALLAVAMVAGLVLSACQGNNTTTSTNLPSKDPTDSSDRWSVDLSAYGFERKQYQNVNNTPENQKEFTAETIEYLTANAENGGLVLLTGTGFKYLFSDDNWQNENGRWSVEGLHLTSTSYHENQGTLLAGLNPTQYSQKLSLSDGIVHTSMGFGTAGTGYKTSIFTSQKNKHLMSMTLTNTETVEKTWTVSLPEDGFYVTTDLADPTHLLYGERKEENYFTKTAWAFWSEKELSGRCITLQPGETVEFRFTFTTDRGEGENYRDLARAALELDKTYEEILAEHKAVWQGYWDGAALVQTLDENINKLYYRSIYWNFCQNGGDNFIQPEAPFAGLNWDYSDQWEGHGFSYGSSGLSIPNFLLNGQSELARNLLELLYNPEALVSNAQRYTDIEGAYSFAHENNYQGYEIAGGKWGTQRHIDGYVASMFKMYYEYNPDDTAFFEERVYPVFRGVAQFYRGNLTWSDEHQAYLLPNWLSLSEGDVMYPNALDIVLNAVFVMKQAAQYARELGVDEQWAAQWEKLADQIYIPQNDEIYTQYLGDTGDAAGSGYFGKRAQIYLGIPYLINSGFIDIDKAIKTMETSWVDNNYGEGMISFIAGWNAKTATLYGLGDLALDMLERYFDCNPDFICEDDYQRPYFQSHCFYAQALISMFVQGSDGVIRTFAAVPTSWKTVKFSNVTTIGGVKVSGEYKNGKVVSLTYTDAQGDVLYTQNDNKDVSVSFDKTSGKTTVALAEYEKQIITQVVGQKVTINPVLYTTPSLPATVQVILEDGSTRTVPVKWEMDSGYIASYDDGHCFYGNLVLNDQFDNPQNLRAECVVNTVWPTMSSVFWMSDMEEDNLIITRPDGSTADVELSTEFAHSGSHSVKITTYKDFWPHPSNTGRIGIETPVDASGYKYFVFWVYDLAGSDTNGEYKLLGENGKILAEGWTDDSITITKNTWTRAVINVEGVDLSEVKYLDFGMWSPGVHYVDDLYFTNDLWREDPTVPLHISTASSITVAGTALTNAQLKQADTAANAQGLKLDMAMPAAEQIAVVARDSGAKVDVRVDGNSCYITVTAEDNATTTVYKLNFKN